MIQEILQQLHSNQRHLDEMLKEANSTLQPPDAALLLKECILSMTTLNNAFRTYVQYKQG